MFIRFFPLSCVENCHRGSSITEAKKKKTNTTTNPAVIRGNWKLISDKKINKKNTDNNPFYSALDPHKQSHFCRLNL